MDLLYAEVLLNIRQLTVCAVLTSPPTSDTRAQLRGDGEAFNVIHAGHSSTLTLPARVTGPTELQILACGTKEISFRLPLAGNEGNTIDLENEVPWSADSLAPSTEIRCRRCGQTVVHSGSIKLWKDLPSEHWADMMDFWHCHKPAVPNDSENCHTAGASKGYAAANKLSAEPGVGFINLSYFLLAEKDCSGLTVKTGEHTSPRTAACAGCGHQVGTVDEQAGGWRLMKWSLSVIPEDGAAQQMFPEDAFVAAQLLALVDSQAVKKFIIHCDDDAQGLFMWVFNADLRYCSSLRGPTPRRAMKVFYGYHNAMDLRAKQTLSIEELQVPLDVLETVRDSLTRSTSLLPPSARAFQQWRVGLLERFDLASRTKANG